MRLSTRKLYHVAAVVTPGGQQNLRRPVALQVRSTGRETPLGGFAGPIDRAPALSGTDAIVTLTGGG